MQEACAAKIARSKAALLSAWPTASPTNSRNTASTGPFVERASCRARSHRSGTLAAELGQDVLLGRKIIKKGTLTYIGRFSDVLHSGFQEAALGEESQSSAVQAIAGFGAMAFAAAGARGDLERAERTADRAAFSRGTPYLTIGQVRPIVNIGQRSHGFPDVIARKGEAAWRK